MKKLFFLLISILCFSACQSNDNYVKHIEIIQAKPKYILENEKSTEIVVQKEEKIKSKTNTRK